MTTMLEKSPNTELFPVRIFLYFLRIHSEYRKIRIRNNSVFGHFSRKAIDVKYSWKQFQNIIKSLTSFLFVQLQKF